MGVTCLETFPTGDLAVSNGEIMYQSASFLVNKDIDGRCTQGCWPRIRGKS